MKGYFSQLARHTGLRFSNAARSKSPARHAQRPSPSLLHVEEVTFLPAIVASPVTDKLDMVKDRTTQTTQTTTETSPLATATPSHEAFSEGTSSTDVQLSSPQPEPRKSTAASIETEDLRPLSTEHQFPLPQRNVERDHIFEMPVDGAKLEHVQAKLVPPVSETTSPLASSREGEQPQVPVQAVSDLDPRDPAQREVLVRQYLREVRAWVAAPPTEIPDVAENALTEENQVTTAWQPEDVTTFSTAREPFQPATQTTQQAQIDVHETSLSIGSISVVIEDPKPAVTTIAPTPTAPTTQPQPQPEPISLSRYYLQRW